MTCQKGNILLYRKLLSSIWHVGSCCECNAQGFPSWESVTFHSFPSVQAERERDKEKDVSLKTLKASNLFKTYNLLAVNGRMFWKLNFLNAY